MKDLGHLEAAVMQCLWATTGPQSVRDVLSTIDYERPLAYTTVMTVLDNLHSKGLVGRTKAGRAWQYTSTTSREEHTARVLEEVLDSAQDRGATLLHFVGALGADEIAELRAALDGDAPDRNRTGR